jgi:hypothetical protein
LKPLSEQCGTEETTLNQLRRLGEDRELDREALKSALRALTRLASELGFEESPGTWRMRAADDETILADDAAKDR